MSVPILADLKAQLGITVGTYDNDLTAYLNAALTVVESRVGPSTIKAFTENIVTHSPALNLSYRPVQSITSITPLLNTFPSFTPADVNFDADSGALWRKDLGSLAGAWAVAYTAGYAAFPDNFNRATVLLAQHYWTTRRGVGDRRGVDVLPATTSDIPDMVLTLLSTGPYFGGIA